MDGSAAPFMLMINAPDRPQEPTARLQVLKPVGSAPTARGALLPEHGSR